MSHSIWTKSILKYWTSDSIEQSNKEYKFINSNQSSFCKESNQVQIKKTKNDGVITNIGNENNQVSKRFDFLDGYRGSLALIVVISHSCQSPECRILALGSQKYAISGFFLLSSFLLTYRLVNDFYKENSSKILSILQYFIRRFFRIYVVYALFSCLVIYGPRFFAGYLYGQYPPISQIILIGFPGITHLWTIPPEIKYYFLIPIFSLCIYLSKRLAPVFFSLCFVWITYDQIYNVFALSANDVVSSSRHSHYLIDHFTVFFIGSVFAMAYFLTEHSEKIMSIVKRDRIQLVLKYIALKVFLYGWVFHTENLNTNIDYTYRSRPAIIWSLALFMSLLSSNSPMNPIVGFFKLRFFRSCGKFSFGIYLFHPTAIHFVSTNETYFKLRVTSSIIVVYIFGFLFYHLVEKHLVNLANYLCSKLESLKCFQN